MRILIASGGTRTPIDPVRDITNKSSGTFGSKIATEALMAGHEVVFFCADGSKTPFDLDPLDVRPYWDSVFNGMNDFANPARWHRELEKFTQKYLFACRYQNKYNQVGFKTYEAYALGLKTIVNADRPDAIILAAAVSDYYVTNQSEAKIHSKECPTIELGKTEKLISKIAEWTPDAVLVGFKLLVNASKEELTVAAHESIHKNRCDMVVANDYADMQQGHHDIYVYEKIGDGISCEKYTENQAKGIIARLPSIKYHKTGKS